MRRFGQMIRLCPDMVEEYKRIHVRIWPEIEQAIRELGITNYSIFFKDSVLFAYFEYAGPEEAYDAQMETLANAPRMQEWWSATKAMQIPLDTRAEGEWWADMEEVFHQD